MKMNDAKHMISLTYSIEAQHFCVRIFHLRKKEKKRDKLFRFTADTAYSCTVYTSKSTGMKTEKNLFGEQKNTCCYTLREHRTVYLSLYFNIYALIHKNIMVIIYEHTLERQ